MNPGKCKKELSTGSAYTHEIVHLVKTENPYKTENFFYKHLANKRLKGEWFHLSESELD